MPAKTDPYANIPPGREAEFLTDARLAEFHADRLAKADKDDPDRDALVVAARASRRAAMETDAASSEL